MIRRRRALVIGLALVLLAVVALIAARSALAAAPVRAAVEARLSATFGQPVTIESLRVSFAPQVALTGSGVRVGAADVAVPAIEIPRVVVIPDVSTLFSPTIVVRDVLLDGIVISVARGDGGWRVPIVSPRGTPGEPSGVTIQRVRVASGQIQVFESAGREMRLASGIVDLGAELVPSADGLRITGLTGRIGRAEISGGAHVDERSVRLQFEAPSVADADLPALFALAAGGRPRALTLDRAASVNVAIAIERPSLRLTGEGTLGAPALTVGPFRVEGLKAPFRIAGAQLTFAPATFTTGGGSHRGTVTMDLGADPARWSASSRFERMDVGSLLDTVAGRDTHVDGTGSIDMDMRGRLDETFVRTMHGRAALVVSDGVLRDFPLIAAVNRTLGLAEADSGDTQFERLSATLDVADAVATTDDLAIDAAHLRVLAGGRIRFDGPLDLRGRAIVSEERAAAAVARVRELARLRTRGEMVLPLTIGGSLGQPAFGIDIKSAVREGVKDELLRRLRRIIK